MTDGDIAKRSWRTIPVVHNYLVGLMYLCIATTLALGLALMMQWYLIENPPTGASLEGSTPDASTAPHESSPISQLVLVTITAVVSILSVLLFVALPLIVGSAGNALVRASLTVFRREASWRSVFFAKTILLLLSFVFLTVMVILSNLTEGYALLIAGAVTTLFATILLIAQLFIRPAAHKNPTKAW